MVGYILGREHPVDGDQGRAREARRRARLLRVRREHRRRALPQEPHGVRILLFYSVLLSLSLSPHLLVSLLFVCTR